LLARLLRGCLHFSFLGGVHNVILVFYFRAAAASAAKVKALVEVSYLYAYKGVTQNTAHFLKEAMIN